MDLIVKVHRRHPEGRIFGCGDIHGEYTLLSDALSAVNFNEERDLLISVGDLVDRGRESERVLEFLDKPWFAPVKGNHDFMASGWCDESNHFMNGGCWMYGLPESEREEYRSALVALPLAIEVETLAGMLGVVHADVPTGNWESFRELIGRSEEIVTLATWDRSRWKSGGKPRVSGVDWVIVGHTAHDEVSRSTNVIDLDTGCGYFWGKLTLMDLDSLEVVAESSIIQ